MRELVFFESRVSAQRHSESGPGRVVVHAGIDASGLEGHLVPFAGFVVFRLNPLGAPERPLRDAAQLSGGRRAGGYLAGQLQPRAPRSPPQLSRGWEGFPPPLAAKMRGVH